VEQRTNDRQRFFQLIHTLTKRRKAVSEFPELVFQPAGTNADFRTAPGKMIDGDGRFGQHAWTSEQCAENKTPHADVAG
jgi:hypothetical protein